MIPLQIYVKVSNQKISFNFENFCFFEVFANFELFWVIVHRLAGRLCPQGRSQFDLLLFWRLPRSYWKTKWKFYASSGRHHRLSGRLCLQERSQLDFLLFWRLPRSYWKTKWMFYALLESTTVLLEDSVSKRDPNWIFYSSGDYHGLTGRPNKFSMLFWKAPPSYWKILSLFSVVDSVFHKKFFVVSCVSSSCVYQFFCFDLLSLSIN